MLKQLLREWAFTLFLFFGSGTVTVLLLEANLHGVHVAVSICLGIVVGALVTVILESALG